MDGETEGKMPAKNTESFLPKPAQPAETSEVVKKPKRPEKETSGEIDAQTEWKVREEIAREKTKKEVEKRAEEGTKKPIEEAAEEAAEEIKSAQAKKEAPQTELAKGIPTDPEFVENNPHLIYILKEVVSAPEGQYKNEKWVKERIRKLSSLATKENQEVVVKVLKEIMRRPGVAAMFDAYELQEALGPLIQEVIGYHWGQLPPRAAEFLRDPSLLTDEQFNRLPKKVQAAIREYDNTLSTDEAAIDTHFLEKIRGAIAGEEISKDPTHLPDPEVVRNQLLDRLREKREEVVRPQRLREEQLKASAEQRERFKIGDFEFPPQYFTTQDVEILRRGRDGEREWFEGFLSRAEVMVRSPLRLELPELTKLTYFYDYLELAYGLERGKQQANYYRTEIDRRTQYHIMRLRLLYQPGKPEDMIQALQFLKPDDLDYFSSVRFANYTIPLYEDTVKNILSERASNWLRLDETRDARLRRMAQLEARVRDQRVTNRVTNEEKLELQNLRIEEDKWGEGVMLWDTDIQGSFPHWSVLDSRRYEAEQLVLQKLAEEERREFYNPETSSERRTELEEMAQRRFEDKEREEYQRCRLSEEEEAEWKREGRPLVDITVQEDLIRHLKAQGLELGRDFQEWEVRKAVSMASYFMNLSARLPSIAASMARLPEAGKSKSRAPVFEDLLRIFNPEAMYFERFGFAGELGKVTRALFKEEYFKERGKALKVTNLPEWKRLEKSNDPVIERNRRTLEFFEQELNIPFLELIRGGFLSIGGNFDVSIWRAQLGLVDKVAEKFAQAGELAEHVGLGFQLGLADGYAHAEAERWVEAEIKTGRIRPKDKEKEIKKMSERLAFERKLAVTYKISERLPGLVLQLSPTLKNKLLTRDEFQGVDVDILQKMLKSSQLEISTSERFRSRTVNLATESDFAAVCGKYLENLGIKEQSQRETYRSFLEELQKRFKMAKRGEEGSMAEQWARHGFPINITLTDIDWSLAEFLGLGTTSLDRKGRDIVSAFHTREAFTKILFNPSPVKNEEAMGNLLDFRKGVDGYLGTSPAEKMMTTMLRFYLHFNENKLRHLGWILPGLTTLLKNAPSSYAEMVSYSARFYGPFGNAYDETDIATIINSVRDAGGYTEHPELAEQVMEEFKATIDWRALSFVRKYWWILLLFIAKEAVKGEIRTQPT